MSEERIPVYHPPGSQLILGHADGVRGDTSYYVKASDINSLIDSYVVGMRKAGRLGVPLHDIARVVLGVMEQED